MDYKEIIQYIKSKDRRGIETLFEVYGRKLYSYAVSQWASSPDTAWDMIYKTLDTLILKLPGYKIESAQHFNNLIFKIFKNNLRQSYRSERRKEEKLEFVSMDQIEDLPVEDDEFEFSPNPDIFRDYYKTEVLESPLFSALKTALEKLDSIDKELLLLRAQNYTYDEIARMMQIENKQLKVKHHRAVKKLKELIEKQQKTIL